MKEDEIIKGNMLIAFFMGSKEMSSTTTPSGVKTITSITMPPQFYHPLPSVRDYEIPQIIRYHSSWDWLMPVVEKIEHTKGMTIIINGISCEILKFGKRVAYINGDSKLQSTWEAIVWFLNPQF